MLIRLRILVLTGVGITAGFLSACTLIQRQGRTTGTVKVYAYPINNFTKIPISIYSIQDAADTIITSNHCFKYVVQLDSLLRHTTPDHDSLFTSGSVRTAICATSFETIYLDRQSDIYYKKQVYRNTKTTYAIVKKIFPPSIRDRYLRQPG